MNVVYAEEVILSCICIFAFYYLATFFMRRTRNASHLTLDFLFQMSNSGYYQPSNDYDCGDDDERDRNIKIETWKCRYVCTYKLYKIKQMYLQNIYCH